jgi:hypothetical protein
MGSKVGDRYNQKQLHRHRSMIHIQLAEAISKLWTATV